MLTRIPRPAAPRADTLAPGLVVDALDAGSVDRLPPCAQSCIASSSSGSGCAGDLSCACDTPEYVNSLACCVSSSCSQADLQIAIGIFARDVCLSTVTQDVIASTKCDLINSSPDLRKRQAKRHTSPRNVARTMDILSRDGLAAEFQQRALEARSDNAKSESKGLSIGAIAGIAVAAVCGIAIIAVGVFLYLRRRKRGPRKKPSAGVGKMQISPPQQHQKEVDIQHKQEQEQLQQQLQQMQSQLRKKKLQEEKEKQKKTQKEKNDEKEERQYVAELFELPGWMPDRSTTVNELADTGHPRYEMFTDANTAELSGGTPIKDNEENHPYGYYPRRSRSYTAELAGASIHLSDDELTPLKRSHSDGGNLVSPAEHISTDSGRVVSPYEVSPPTATVPGMAFFRSDWRSAGRPPAPMASFNPHPAIPLGLSLDTTSVRGPVPTGKKAKEQRAGGRRG